MFRVDIRNLVKNRLYLTKETHIQPSEYESWPYYEYEFLLEDFKEYIENENKKNKEGSDKYNKFTPSSMMSSMKSSMNSLKAGQMPKVPKF